MDFVYVESSVVVPRGQSKNSNKTNKIDQSWHGRGYTHDGRADKYPYLHDRCANKDCYPHDRNVTDDLCSLIKLCFAFIMVNFST